MGAQWGQKETIKLIQRQIEVINRAGGEAPPVVRDATDRSGQTLANPSQCRCARGLGQAATESQPFHNEEKRKLAERNLRRGGQGGAGIISGEEFLGWRGSRHGGTLGRHLGHAHKVGFTNHKCQASNPEFSIIGQSSEV